MEIETSKSNKSLNQKSQHQQCTILDFEANPKKTSRINSPKSLSAIKQLGYNQSDLIYLSFKDFKATHPELIGQDKDSQKLRYEYAESLRKEKINEIKRLREKTDLTKGNNTNKSRSSTYSNGFKNESKNNFTAIENDQKAFERMKAKNEGDLINMVQYALTRELMRKEAEEKLRIQKDRKEEYDQKLLEKRNEEERVKREKERIQEQKRKEVEENQRKLDQLRYKEAQDKAKKELIEEKKRVKYAMKKHQEEERKREEFQMKVNSMLDENKQRVEGKLKDLEEKENDRKKKLELKQKQMQLENEEKAQIQKEKYDLTLKTMENNLNRMRTEFSMKQEDNEKKRKDFEKRSLQLQKEKDEEAKKKAEEIKRVQETNEFLLRQKVEEYNERQRLLSERKKQQEKELEERNRQRLEEISQNNERIKSTIKKNEERIEMNKTRTMMKIKEKEQNTIQVQKEKDLLNKRLQEENIQKRLEQEEKIRQTEVMQINRREETLEWIKNKADKVDEFNAQKSIINDQKRQIQDEITRKKQEYSERFNSIFQQKTINQNTIRTIQGMFPENPKIGALLENFQTLNSETSTSKIKDQRGQSAKGNYGTQTNSTIFNRSTQQADYDRTHYKRAVSTKANKAKPTKLYLDKESKPISQIDNNNYKAIKTTNDNNAFVYSQENKNTNRDRDNYNDYNNKIKMPAMKYNDTNASSEMEITQRLKDYRLSLNKELLNILAEEKKKEAERESQLENCRYNPTKERELEKRFGEERAIASMKITQKNE